MRYFMLKHVEQNGKLVGICLVLSAEELTSNIHGNHKVVELSGFLSSSPNGYLSFVDEDLFKMCYGENLTDAVKHIIKENTAFWSFTSFATTGIRHSSWWRI